MDDLVTFMVGMSSLCTCLICTTMYFIIQRRYGMAALFGIFPVLLCLLSIAYGRLMRKQALSKISIVQEV